MWPLTFCVSQSLHCRVLIVGGYYITWIDKIWWARRLKGLYNKKKKVSFILLLKPTSHLLITTSSSTAANFNLEAQLTWLYLYWTLRFVLVYQTLSKYKTVGWLEVLFRDVLTTHIQKKHKQQYRRCTVCTTSAPVEPQVNTADLSKNKKVLWFLLNNFWYRVTLIQYWKTNSPLMSCVMDIFSKELLKVILSVDMRWWNITGVKGIFVPPTVFFLCFFFFFFFFLHWPHFKTWTNNFIDLFYLFIELFQFYILYKILLDTL